MKSIQLFSIFFLTLFLLPAISLAQDNLNDDWKYLMQARDKYQNWLESYELQKVLKVTDLVIGSPDLAILDLEIKNGQDWMSLAERYEERNGIDLRRALFNKFIFLADIKREQAGIRIRSAINDYYVDMRFMDGNLVIHESVLKGSRVDSLRINMKRLPKAVRGNGVETKEVTKQKLIKYFKKFYKEKSNFFQHVNFDYNEEEDKEGTYHLEFRINNIKKEVLDDFLFGYFERIQINITLKEDDGDIAIVYELYVEYGSGIINRPRKNDYTDIDPRYKEYLDDYLKNLNGTIREAIQN